MTTTIEPDFYSGKMLGTTSELLNEAHNHLQDVRFYVQAGEIDLCLASIAKVYDLHEQMSKILGEETHLLNCPAVDGFGCRCDEMIKETTHETSLPVRHPSAGA